MVVDGVPPSEVDGPGVGWVPCPDVSPPDGIVGWGPPLEGVDEGFEVGVPDEGDPPSGAVGSSGAVVSGGDVTPGAWRAEFGLGVCPTVLADWLCPGPASFSESAETLAAPAIRKARPNPAAPTATRRRRVSSAAR